MPTKDVGTVWDEGDYRMLDPETGYRPLLECDLLIDDCRQNRRAEQAPAPEIRLKSTRFVPLSNRKNFQR